MPVPDTAFDPIFEGKKMHWAIPGSFTGFIEGEILSVKRTPQSETFEGTNNESNINRKVYYKRRLQYTIEAVIAQEVDTDALPNEGDHVTVEGHVCLCDSAEINWSQDGEAKVTFTLTYYPHMTL